MNGGVKSLPVPSLDLSKIQVIICKVAPVAPLAPALLGEVPAEHRLVVVRLLERAELGVVVGEGAVLVGAGAEEELLADLRLEQVRLVLGALARACAQGRK